MKKIFALAAVATLAASTAFAATGYVYVEDTKQARSAGLEISLVNTSADATLEIYSYKAGKTGDLIATQDIKAGVTTDIRLQRPQLPVTDAVAILKAGDTVLDTVIIELGN